MPIVLVIDVLMCPNSIPANGYVLTILDHCGIPIPAIIEIYSHLVETLELLSRPLNLNSAQWRIQMNGFGELEIILYCANGALIEAGLVMESSHGDRTAEARTPRA